MRIEELVVAPGQTCERCYQKSVNAQYFLVARTHFQVFLPSPHVIAHDPHTRTIRTRSGHHLEYHLTAGDFAYHLTPDFIPHIFCGRDCGLQLTRQPVIWSEELFQESPTVDLIAGKLLDLVLLDPRSIEFRVDTCYHCGREFPNLSKRFLTRKILETRTVQQSNKDKGMLPGFEFGQSDFSPDQGHGQSYFYRFAQGFETGRAFCSDECTFKYCRDTESIAMFPSFVMAAHDVVVSPKTVEINRALGQPYPFYPQKIQSMNA